MSTHEPPDPERAMLESRLDGCRAETVRKVSGLTWELATRRLGPSATSAAGLLKHLTDVERWWFRHMLDGESDVPRRSRADSPNGAFDLVDGDTLEALIADYQQASDESRAIAARHEMADRTARPVEWIDDHPTMWWVYLHMIEENSRHNGHLDIYRELLDGQTDDFGAVDGR